MLSKVQLPAALLVSCEHWPFSVYPFNIFPVMVSVGISSFGRTDFYWSVVKINGSYYWNTLLRQHLLPAIRSISGTFFAFQQDNAPAHRARKMVAHAAVGRDSGLHRTALLYPRKRWTLWTPDFNIVIVRLRTSCSCTVVRLCDFVYGLISTLRRIFQKLCIILCNTYYTGIVFVKLCSIR